MFQTATTAINPLATPFTPQYFPNDDHERTDAILEFAQETGLWGLPGGEREPDNVEYQEMVDVFYALNPQHHPYDHEDVFSEEEEETDEEETDEEETDNDEDYDDVTPHHDAVDYDQMFEFMEQQNLLNNTSADVPELIQQQEEPEPQPLRWEDVTADMQDYALDVMAEEGRLEDEMTDEYALSIWASYVEDCWDQSRHSELNALAGQNELRGILPSTM